MGKPWTEAAALPGGDFPFAEVEARIAALAREFPFLGPEQARRLFRAYGTDAWKIMEGARSAADLGRRFGPLSEREVAWLKAKEWARSADDILWRRSKLGLHMSKEEQDALRSYMSAAAEAPELKRAGG
jgi:glycerol-3-phosphate dehydrogenase